MQNIKTNDTKNAIRKDLSIIVLSVFIAIVLIKTNMLGKILTSTQEFELLGSFLAGLFFTSVFTSAPAIVTLGQIGAVQSPISTALFGAAGAVVGDLVIFRFIRDRLSEHLVKLLENKKGSKRFRTLLQLKLFRWFTFALGGIIIASPFPDEIGISLLGFAKMKPAFFALVSFAFNFLGILIIALAARTLIS